MVSTRGHPQDFPEPDASPSKQNGSTTRGRKSNWAHTPSNLTLLWLCISVPLVVWDTGYVLLRPHSMPGGWAHLPLWQPYELYGRIDYMYGWKAYNDHNGFTGAQGIMNAVETLLYCWYLYVVYVYGKPSSTPGRGAPNPSAAGTLGEARYVDGKMGSVATMIGFSAAVMTLSKTLLYALNEYCAGFENVSHNSLLNLFFLWILPNGAWLIFPSYMSYVFASEIMEGLALAAGSSDDTALVKAPALKE